MRLGVLRRPQKTFVLPHHSASVSTAHIATGALQRRTCWAEGALSLPLPRRRRRNWQTESAVRTPRVRAVPSAVGVRDGIAIIRSSYTSRHGPDSSIEWRPEAPRTGLSPPTANVNWKCAKTGDKVARNKSLPLCPSTSQKFAAPG
jgi:hypothetical protein